ncbi:SCO1664 family protein [Frankia inefficax]|uniref:SCO1664 family protein n=1 Tax=Pseudofrankia inefficax (strain DSM 45817 / CECT 9037 / DDB 130130 / EuI1c) TaxID=298654 RepID=E3J2W2_PSEI1|nr:hypothetical protein FraEuI1c_3766 [Pseudofrankia inefficax]
MDPAVSGPTSAAHGGGGGRAPDVTAAPGPALPAARGGPAGRSCLEPSDAGGLDAAGALALLRTGELSIEGRLVEASNATLFCAISGGGVEARCVYKPVRGERPLWDFPDGTLAAREVAAYALSEQLGAGLVPPTVLRDGPFGTGMAQLWIDVDETVDVVRLVQGGDRRLRRIALFDAVINNADRKGCHLLPAPSGRVYAIDHGVTFHGEDKLRTVLWNWRGKRFDAAERALLDELAAALAGPFGDQLDDLLTRAEVAALRARIDRLRAGDRFPQPSDDWPPIPWPPF